MFQSLVAVSVEAAGRGGGPAPQTAVLQGPAGTAVDAVAPGGPAGGGVGATHSGPAGPELPQGQGPPGWAMGGAEMLM